MREKQAAASWGHSVVTAILALPRTAKRVIMALADAVAIPTALWAALALKFDRVDPLLDRTFAYFGVALASALFFFWLFGLYRAVIRFMGLRAMMTVIAGVSLSVLVLAVYDHFLSTQQIPLTAFGIYWALALPYVGGSRFIARYLFLRRSGALGTAARVAIYGAGDAGARVCSALLGGAGLRAGGFHRRQAVAAGQPHQRHPRLRAGCAPRTWCASGDIDRILLAHAVGFPAAPPGDPARRSSRWACTCSRCPISRT